MVGKRKGSNLVKSPVAEWGKALERSTSTHMDTQVHNLTHICTPCPRLSPGSKHHLTLQMLFWHQDTNPMELWVPGFD